MTNIRTYFPGKPFAHKLLAGAVLASLCTTASSAGSWFSLGSANYRTKSAIPDRQEVAARRLYLNDRTIDPGAVPGLPELPPPESPPVYEPPPRPVDNHVSRVVLDDPGKLFAVEGNDCVTVERSGSDFSFSDLYEFDASVTLPVGIPGSLEIPENLAVPDATVILNGWRFRYLDEDHHINNVDALIRNIELDGNMLKWEAAGDFSDRDTNGYEFCYQYLALAWDRSNVHAIADTRPYRNSVDEGNTTALSTMAGFAPNPWSESFSPMPGEVVAPSRDHVAVLPNGFSFLFHDHHLLQVAYNKGRGTQYLEDGHNESTADPANIGWISQAIVKDNESRRDYSFRERVSTLAGKDVHVIDPPFVILPREDDGFGYSCIGATEETKTREFVIRDLPFDYALPMLTGWDLAYTCDDQEVLKMGIWISDIHYEKDATIGRGTLRYKVSSRLRDDDLVPAHIGRHKASILGLNASGPYFPSLTIPVDDDRLQLDLNVGPPDTGPAPQGQPYRGLSDKTIVTPASGWSLEAYR